jgi:hypothetical protein
MPVEQGRRTKPAFLAVQGLRVTGLVGDIELGPGVLAAEHEVADEWGRGVVAEGDDDGGREARCLREQLAVGVEVGAAAVSQSLTDSSWRNLQVESASPAVAGRTVRRSV